MKFPRIKSIAYTRASDKKFPNVFSEIVRAMVSNQSMFNLPYTPQQLEERCRQIVEKTDLSREGSKKQKNERQLERMVCEQILSRLQAAVMERARQAATFEEGLAIINLSKFTPYKRRERVGTIIPPTPKARITKLPGTIFLKWNYNKNVYTWIIQHVAGTDISPTANWTTIAVVGRSQYTITQLSQGYHSFRLIAVSAVGESEPSPAVTEWAR